jgi:hypothetical protein
VTLFAAALIVGGWSLTWRLTEGPVRPAFFLVLLAIPSASTLWEPRPHAFSLLFIPATVFLITRERFPWLPLVFVIWANCHGGVLLGLVLLIAGITAHVIARPDAWKRGALTIAGCALAMNGSALSSGIHSWCRSGFSRRSSPRR